MPCWRFSASLCSDGRHSQGASKTWTPRFCRGKHGGCEHLTTPARHKPRTPASTLDLNSLSQVQKLIGYRHHWPLYSIHVLNKYPFLRPIDSHVLFTLGDLHAWLCTEQVVHRPPLYSVVGAGTYTDPPPCKIKTVGDTTRRKGGRTTRDTRLTTTIESKSAAHC